nr:uncharacterized protein LOC123760123 [Procambarus clarkii]
MARNVSYNNCSRWPGEEEEARGLHEVYKAVFHVVFPVLITVGVITNVLNLVVLTRPMMRNRAYRWLRCLATVDIMLYLLTIPVCLAMGGHGPTTHTLAFYYAHFGWALSISSQILSFYLMSWFAYDRFLAVCRHDKYPDSQRALVFEWRVAGSLVWVMALYAPTAAVGQVCQVAEGWVPLDGYTLGMGKVWYRGYSWVREIFSRVAPAAVLTFCNVKIAYRLKHLRSIRDSFGSGVPPARRERERRLVLLLFWVTAFFYLYNTPVTIYYLGFLNYSQKHTYSLLTFGAISNMLQMMGNISNSILYFLINPDFQRTLRALLHLRVPPGARDQGRDSIRSQGSFKLKLGVSLGLNGNNQIDSGLQPDLPPPATPVYRSYNS